MVVEISRFNSFSNGGRPPSCICRARIWTNHDEYLVVSIVVQNLVGINAVVLTICKFCCRQILTFFQYHRNHIRIKALKLVCGFGSRHEQNFGSHHSSVMKMLHIGSINNRF